MSQLGAFIHVDSVTLQPLGPVVSLRNLASWTKQLTAPASLREIIDWTATLSSLAEFGEKAEVAPLLSVVPFVVNFTYSRNNKAKVAYYSVHFTILKDGQPFTDFFGNSGRLLQEPGTYQVAVKSQVVAKEGYQEVDRSFTIQASPKPKPAPEPAQKPMLVLSLSSTAGIILDAASFVVNGTGAPAAPVVVKNPGDLASGKQLVTTVELAKSMSQPGTYTVSATGYYHTQFGVGQPITATSPPFTTTAAKTSFLFSLEYSPSLDLFSIRFLGNQTS